ncbi:MAG: M61 family metallopeptidase [Prochloraceae cyanobacterium]|nr:M61 family metallopeptidase [Prochloraceae cyanobacterium]
MTKATAIKEIDRTKTTPTIFYQVAMPNPASHLFEVTLQVKGWSAAKLDLRMPVWTPGSYLVREYTRHLQDFSAFCGETEQVLSTSKQSKNHWEINTENVSEITVFYRIFANNLTVRTNHLDATHGYFNGAALFFSVSGWEKSAIAVKIILPQSDWKISTALPLVQNETNTFKAKDFDTLVDSPFEIGIHNVYEFEAAGVPHKYAIWGQGNAKPEQIIEDTKKIIQVEADLFGGLPYSEYLFILHLSDSGFGGLEHKDSCSLNYPRFNFRDREKYHRFLQLVAHEFFHLWNVKRIRPLALETFDYYQENYTTSLWFCEGVTSYYDLLIPLKAGIYDRQTFLKNLSKDINKFLSTPGRKVQPLGESSFDAWIKLYRRDANSDNSQISYYLKGQLVALLLDLAIRSRHQNQRSLDDIMVKIWDKFGKDEVGFSPADLWQVIESVADFDLTNFRDRYINTTQELPFNEYLKPFGLEVKKVMDDEPFPDLGIKVQTENGKEIIKFVSVESNAAKAGIDPLDELLAIDGFRVTASNLSDRLKNYQPGDFIEITLFHKNELRTFSIQLQEPRPNRYEVIQIDSPTSSQKQNLSGWLSIK